MNFFPFRILLLLFVIKNLVYFTFAEETVRIGLADGFDFPCGDPVGSGEGYYIFRGWTTNHPGEDWNGNGMGNTDLGDPVYSIAKGVVIYARNAGGGWGNTVIVRHAYRNPRTGMIEVLDSFYTHLDEINTEYGAIIPKGTQVGTIGTNNGLYVAHLHFELRHGPGLNIGMDRSRFPRNMNHYHRPRGFIEEHRNLRADHRTRATVRIDQFQAQ